MGVSVKREMKLSFDLTIEEILKAIKNDIIQVKEHRDNCCDRIIIKTEVFS